MTNLQGIYTIEHLFGGDLKRLQLDCCRSTHIITIQLNDDYMGGALQLKRATKGGICASVDGKWNGKTINYKNTFSWLHLFVLHFYAL